MATLKKSARKKTASASKNEDLQAQAEQMSKRLGESAQQVWLGGRAIPMRSRQTELRDRYLQQAGPLPRAYSK